MVDTQKTAYRIGTYLTLAGCVLTTLLTTTLPIAAAQLKDRITVEAPFVTLGDIFEDAGAASSVIVTDAPAPGRLQEISVSKVAYYARINGLDWSNRTPATRIAIYRSGKAVPTDVLTDALSLSLETQDIQMPTGSVLQIDLTSGQSALFTAQEEDATVAVERIAYERRTGKFSAIVRAPANNKSAPSVRILGRATPALDIPVLARQINKGDRISGNDIEYLRVAVKRIAPNTITDPAHLIGMTPKRALRTGLPIRINEIETPTLVKKNDLVTIRYLIGGLSLATRARATQDASKGDIITLVNLRSGQKIQAIVTGPNTADIEPTLPNTITSLSSAS